MNIVIKFCLSFLLTLTSLIFTTSTNAQSNDPFGDIYITRKAGDLSNCGPIAALMLSNYFKKTASSPNLLAKISYARKISQVNKNSNRWWRIGDVKKYFSHEKIKHKSVTFQNKYTITNQLDKNGIVLINVNMNNLSRGKEIGKPYFTFPFPGGWGHFLVIVGYKKVGNKLLFEVHDSYVRNGNNRLYDADEIQFALNRYNPEILIVKR